MAWIGLPTSSWNYIPGQGLQLVGRQVLRAQEARGGGGASLVAQWLRICLLMQGTRVRALVWEDPTCRGAARPVGHDC